MAHSPLVVADRLSKSNTATATEEVDIGGVIWKWTQVHPDSLILQTQATVEISWALPEMIWQSHLCTIWQTPWECHKNKNDIMSDTIRSHCKLVPMLQWGWKTKIQCPLVFMTCYRKALTVGILNPANSLHYTASYAYLQNDMHTNHNNNNQL